jgi:hypothetical protein
MGDHYNERREFLEKQKSEEKAGLQGAYLLKGLASRHVMELVRI